MSFYWSYLLEKMAQLDPDILYKLYPAYLQQISDKMSRKRVKGGFTQLITENGPAQVGRLELLNLQNISELQMTSNHLSIYK